MRRRSNTSPYSARPRSGTTWWIAKLDTITSNVPSVGRQRLVEVVARDLDARVAGEPGPGARQHLVLKSSPTPVASGYLLNTSASVLPSPVPEVEDPVDALGQQLEHHLQPLDAVRNGVAFAQVPQRPFRLRPTVDVRGGHHGVSIVWRTSLRSRIRTTLFTAFR